MRSDHLLFFPRTEYGHVTGRHEVDLQIPIHYFHASGVDGRETDSCEQYGEVSA